MVSFLDKILDVLYPAVSYCSFCQSRQESREIRGLCCYCLKKIVFVANNYCVCCGRQLPEERDVRCKFCAAIDFYFDQARAVTLYQGIIEKIIYRFKYEQERRLADSLGQLLLLFYGKYFSEIKIDGLIYVPLHKKRRKLRGFNQAELLARELFNYTGLNIYNNLLIRNRQTPPLYELTYRERQHVLQNAFRLNYKYKLQEKNLLLIDDIFTTGSTVNEISRLLKTKTKINNIYVFTLATANSDF